MRSKASNQFVALLFLILLTNRVSAIENTTDLYLKGVKLVKAGQIDEAIRIFKNVIKKSPYYTLGHYGLGKSYLYKSGKFEDAIIHLRMSVILDKNFSKGYFYLGMAYFFSKKYSHAINSFNTAFKKDERIIESLYNIGVIYDLFESTYKAKVFFNKYLDLKYKAKDDDRIF